MLFKQPVKEKWIAKEIEQFALYTKLHTVIQSNRAIFCIKRILILKKVDIYSEKAKHQKAKEVFKIIYISQMKEEWKDSSTV